MAPPPADRSRAARRTGSAYSVSSDRRRGVHFDRDLADQWKAGRGAVKLKTRRDRAIGRRPAEAREAGRCSANEVVVGTGRRSVDDLAKRNVDKGYRYRSVSLGLLDVNLIAGVAAATGPLAASCRPRRNRFRRPQDRRPPRSHWRSTESAHASCDRGTSRPWTNTPSVSSTVPSSAGSG